MSAASRASSSKRFKSLQFYKEPKDFAGVCAWVRQMFAEHPGKQFILNDDALSIEERKANPAYWAMLEEALKIVNAEREQAAAAV